MINITKIVSDFEDYANLKKSNSDNISKNYINGITYTNNGSNEEETKNKQNVNHCGKNIKESIIGICRENEYTGNELIVSGKEEDDKNSFEKLQSRITDLEDVITHLNNELRLARAKIFSMNNPEKLEKKCEKEEDENNKANNRCQINDRDILLMESRIKKLQEVNSVLEDDLKKALRKLGNISTKCPKSCNEEKYLQENRTLKKQITSLYQERQTLTNQIEELKLQWMKINNILQERNKEFEHLQNECNLFSHRNEDLKAWGDKLTLQNKQLQAELKLTEEQLKELMNSEQKLVNKNNDLKMTIEERIQKVTITYEKERMEFKEIIDNLNAQLEVMETKSIRNLKKEKKDLLEHYQTELDILKEHLKLNTEKANDEMQKLNDRWRERFDNYRRDMHVYVQELEAKMEKTRDYNSKVMKDLNEQKETLQNRVSYLEKKGREIELDHRLEIEQINREKQVLKTRLNSTLEEIRLMNANLLEKEHALVELEETVQRECEERDQLLLKLQEQKIIQMPSQKNIFEQDLTTFLPPNIDYASASMPGINDDSFSPKSPNRNKLSLHNSSPEIKMKHSEFVFNVNPYKRKVKNKIKPKKIENRIWK